MYCIVSAFFRSEVVRVLTDVEIPGKVTEFYDMGGLGKRVTAYDITLLTTVYRVHDECHSVPRLFQRGALLALSLR